MVPYVQQWNDVSAKINRGIQLSKGRELSNEAPKVRLTYFTASNLISTINLLRTIIMKSEHDPIRNPLKSWLLNGL